MFFVIRFKSADGLLQQDFDPKQFRNTFGFTFDGEQDILNVPLIEVFIPISSYSSNANIFNRPAQYRGYKRQKTLTEPIVIYNELGKEITANKTVILYQEIIA